jgi:Zn-dependent peptidase ImmA (M78 family)/DNA-binding XRE family transcriptional regulator
MSPDRDVVAGRLRAARENCGMTQQAAGEHLGLSRSLVAQIELGNRRISDDELGRFATLYKTSVSHLTGAEPAVAEDAYLIEHGLAPGLLLDEKSKPGLSSALLLLKAAADLERTLRRPSRRVPHYRMPTPSGAAEALAQGEDTAEQERRRLGLQSAPAPNVVDLVTSQGIHVAATTGLPDGLTCLFLRLVDVGSVIVVNADYGSVRRRFSVLHAYAQALFECGDVIKTTEQSSAGELIAKRASAFAAAFLLPESGIRQVLESLGKGQPSRKSFVLLDPLADGWIRAERRAAPGSQKITWPDCAVIAGRFGVSYKAVVLRLLSLGIISEAESAELLSTKAQRVSDQCLALTHPRAESGSLPEDRSGLKADVLHLAIECYRRELVTRQRLGEIAEMLQLPGLSKTKLIELAEAVR